MAACNAYHLLGDDTEWVDTIRGGSQWQRGRQLIDLFVSLLIFCDVSDVGQFFRSSLPFLAPDVVHSQRCRLQNPNICFTDEEILNYTLLEIDEVLNSNNKSLSDFTELPQIDPLILNIAGNRLIGAERMYNIYEEINLSKQLYSGLNHQQKYVYDSIMQSVSARNGGVFFVYGCGGTGKTFLWRAIISKIRYAGKVVLLVASSGIASLLLPGGRTSHSRFRILLDLDKDSCCAIDVTFDLVELIWVAELIIWDEAPLQHRHDFEAVDRTFRDICKDHVPGDDKRLFGGKVVVLGGDFRQILPVITNGSRCDVVTAAVNKSDCIWRHCTVYELSINMRLRDPKLADADVEQLRLFTDWLLAMGDGRLPAIALDGEDEATWITIPDDLLIPVSADPINSVVRHTFPNLINKLDDINYLKERCILCSTNDVVDGINSHVLEKIPGDLHELYSADSICPTTNNLEEMQIMYPIEFLNTLRFSGIPNHKLELKVGVPIILLRNLNMQRGMCNGTRLIVTKIERVLIEAKIITGSHVGDKVLIHRIDMTPTDSSWPFQFRRHQFPVKVCFAMTINKSQGQTFNNVCAFLSKPVFTHGQLYVVASRVTSRSGLRFYIDNGCLCDNNLMKNLVYKEVFYGLHRGNYYVI